MCVCVCVCVYVCVSPLHLQERESPAHVIKYILSTEYPLYPAAPTPFHLSVNLAILHPLIFVLGLE